MSRSKIILLLLVLFNVFVAIAYSELVSNLLVEGDAVLRSQFNIRINGLAVDSTSNASSSNVKYTGSSTSMNVELNGAGSYVIYNVSVDNRTGEYYSPGEITTSGFNDNIKYEFIGFVPYGVYQGVSYSFKIKVYSVNGAGSGKVSLSYSFRTVDKFSDSYGFTGTERHIDVSYTAKFKLEVWGAQGGTNHSSIYGGYGGYAIGDAYVTRGSTMYIHVGGAGSQFSTDHSYNGGGSRVSDEWNWNVGGSGGGCTHVALTSGLLEDIGYDNKDMVLIVAGGGGGTGGGASRYYYNGGHAGGAVGSSGQDGYAKGGTQTSAGAEANGSVAASFGHGGNAYNEGGGGCGFFGGGSGAHPSIAYSGAGGSSYIGNSLLSNKIMYCYDCTPITNDDDTRTSRNANASDSPVANTPKKNSGYARVTMLPLN